MGQASLPAQAGSDATGGRLSALICMVTFLPHHSTLLLGHFLPDEGGNLELFLFFRFLRFFFAAWRKRMAFLEYCAACGAGRGCSHKSLPSPGSPFLSICA